MMLIDRSVRLWPGRMIQLFWCYEWHPRWRYWLGREGRWGFDVAFFRRRLMVFSWARGRAASYLPVPGHDVQAAAPPGDGERPEEMAVVYEGFKPCPHCGGRVDFAHPAEGEPVYIVFDGPPSHKSGRFVETETKDGRGVGAGEWEKWRDGCWRLGPFWRKP